MSTRARRECRGSGVAGLVVSLIDHLVKDLQHGSHRWPLGRVGVPTLLQELSKIRRTV